MARAIQSDRPAESGAEAVGSAGSPRETPAAASDALYRTRDVVQILGISRRQLQYWSQTGLITPSRKTRGGHHRYTFQDLVSLKAAKRLIDAGVSVQRIRASIAALRETLPRVQQPLAELVLVATADVVLVFRNDRAFEAISGQEWVFEVARFQRELQAWQQASRVRPVPGARPVRRKERRKTA